MHRPGQPYPGAAPLHQVQPSPSQDHGQPNPPAPYAVRSVFAPPQSSIHSPYLHQPPSSSFQQPQGPPESTYYGATNPSPRSTHSASYYHPADKPDQMAAATASIHRPYPPIYHTPQSNSPASVTSPHTNDHGRSMFAQHPPQMTHQMYGGYSTYQPMGPVHPSPYPTHQGPSPMNPQSIMSYAPSNQPVGHGPLSTSPRMKNESSQSYNAAAQTPVPLMAQQAAQTLTRSPSSAATSNAQLSAGPGTAPPSASNAAPGPIPATTPLVVRQDQNGVQWIAFEYSRDRVKMEYTIRCDVESVDAAQLDQEFKNENCVYPRACVPKEAYKGNRLAYETECNQVGWALAELNPCLRGKRGLIQRAVDSWRNSNHDPRLRSRRVRRQAKITTRSKGGAAPAQTPTAGSVVGGGIHGSNQMSTAASRGTGVLPPTSQAPQQIQRQQTPQQQQQQQQGPQQQQQQQQMIHHHAQQNPSPTGHDNAGGPAYSTTPSFQPGGANSQHMPSPNVSAYSGYQTYPVPTTSGSSSSMAPPVQPVYHYGRSGGSSGLSTRDREDKDHEDDELFGAVPEGKRRKFILVEDTQKHARVRVKVTLDQIEMSEIPDSYRKHNSVFPRSYYPVQMQAAGDDTNGGRFVDGDVEEVDDELCPTVGRMTVPCQLSDGDGEVEVCQLTRGKRNRERKLNELGYRMAWGQSRVFSGRPIFLGRALDQYRQKQRNALVSGGQDASTIPSHLQTRTGKAMWQARTRSLAQSESTPAPSPA